MRSGGKHLLAAALGLLLALGLTACGETAKPFDPEGTTKALIEAGAFSEELERLDADILLRLYELDESKVASAVGYASTGLTAEEAAVFEMTDDAAAKEAEGALKAHLDYQIESNEDYRPQEMPKLEKAVVERRGKTLLFLVAADYSAAESVLK